MMLSGKAVPSFPEIKMSDELLTEGFARRDTAITMKTAKMVKRIFFMFEGFRTDVSFLISQK